MRSTGRKLSLTVGRQVRVHAIFPNWQTNSSTSMPADGLAIELSAKGLLLLDIAMKMRPL